MTKLIYTGPSHQVNRDVAAVTGNGALETGKEYDLPADLADSILESNAHWKLAKPAKNPVDDGKEV